MEMPSGGVSTNIANNFVCSATYDNETNQTLINITNDNYLSVNGNCIIDDITYDLLVVDSNLSLSVEGNAIGKNITIFANKYLNDFDEFQADIPIKGNKYKAYNLTITN